MDEIDHQLHIRRLDQIDRILRDPIITLMKIAQDEFGKVGNPELHNLTFPSWVAEGLKQSSAEKTTTKLTTAICCSTLQRLWRQRRRFPFAAAAFSEFADRVSAKRAGAAIPEILAEPFLPGPGITKGEYQHLFINKQSGGLDPLTAAHVFQVLLDSDESKVHTGVGLLACFTMLWSMHRRFPDSLSAGASMPGAPPSAYVTSRCVAALEAFCEVCSRRAEYLVELSRIVTETAEAVDSGDGMLRFTLAFRLERLATVLYEMSELAIDRRGFRKCSEDLEAIVDALGPTSSPGAAELWRQVLARLEALAESIAKKGEEIQTEVRYVMEELLPKLICYIEKGDAEKLKEEFSFQESTLDFLDAEATERYWESSATAAHRAREVCQRAWHALTQAAQFFTPRLAQGAPGISRAFGELAKANREVSQSIRSSLSESVAWCEQIMLREIAHATAGNDSEFDPAELIAGLAATVTAGGVDSPLDIESAVGRSLKGAQSDGSWSPGQPFFTALPLGLSVSTAQVIAVLSESLRRFPEVRTADAALYRFVDWLERTRISIAHSGHVGWVFERAVKPRRIDVWITAFAINALLAVREHVEFRLWEMCEARFKIVRSRKELGAIDAVDLGARHSARLHRRLTRMARRGAGDDFLHADYSIILHGPPGSSKTAITEAFAAEVGRINGDDARLIRITPTDFTRQGEDRLDSEARIIFDLLQHVRGVTVLFDEIDDLLRARDPKDPKPRFMDLVVPAMLNRLQDLRDSCAAQETYFVLATNYVDRIEPALIRKGRIDEAIPLVYPDWPSRQAVVERHAKRAGERIGRFLDKLEKECGTAECGERLAAWVKLLGAECPAVEQAWKELRSPPDGATVKLLSPWLRALMPAILRKSLFEPATRLAPWKTVEEVCGTVEEALVESLTAGTEAVPLHLEATFREHGLPSPEIDRAGRPRGSNGRPAPRQQIYRADRLRDSKHLAREFLTFLFGAATDLAGYRECLECELKCLATEEQRAKGRSTKGEEPLGWQQERIDSLLQEGADLWKRQGRQ